MTPRTKIQIRLNPLTPKLLSPCYTLSYRIYFNAKCYRYDYDVERNSIIRRLMYLVQKLVVTIYGVLTGIKLIKLWRVEWFSLNSHTFCVVVRNLCGRPTLTTGRTRKSFRVELDTV